MNSRQPIGWKKKGKPRPKGETIVTHEAHAPFSRETSIHMHMHALSQYKLTCVCYVIANNSLVQIFMSKNLIKTLKLPL
jgi:hypothetical protein